jgi:hypothetical protein
MRLAIVLGETPSLRAASAMLKAILSCGSVHFMTSRLCLLQLGGNARMSLLA